MSSSADLEHRWSYRRARVTREFGQQFGGVPSVWVRAPGRVDLMGSHTDYNLGCVLTVAIDRDTWIAATPRADGCARVFSSNLQQLARFEVATAAAGERNWDRYVRGVVAVLEREGFRSLGFDAVVHGTLPLASGLSSSASLTVATGKLVEELGGHEIDPLRLARLCQRAENDVVGVPCGVLDPCSSILGRAGHAMLLDCRNLECDHRHVSEELTVVVADTRVARELATSKYGERRAECEEGVRQLSRPLPGVTSLRDVDRDRFERHRSQLPPHIARRCSFVIEEHGRVRPMAEALERGDRKRIRELCEHSFAGARDEYEICVPAMEAMFAALSETPGGVGARQAGAGFGGCLVAIVERGAVDAFMRDASRRFAAAWGQEGSLFEVQIAQGAGRVEERS